MRRTEVCWESMGIALLLGVVISAVPAVAVPAVADTRDASGRATARPALAERIAEQLDQVAAVLGLREHKAAYGTVGRDRTLPSGVVDASGLDNASLLDVLRLLEERGATLDGPARRALSKRIVDLRRQVAGDPRPPAEGAGGIPARVTKNGPGNGANRISGHVMDDRGNPIEGARVVSFPASGGGSAESVIVDSAGHYELSGLENQVVLVKASAEGWISELWEDQPCAGFLCPVADATPIPLADGVAVTGIDFTLTAGSQIAGTVSSRGEFVAASHQVTLFDEEGMYQGDMHTDDDGRYVFRALSAGTYFARASRTGYGSQLYQGLPCVFGCTVTDGTPIVVDGKDAASGIDFDLPPHGTVEGRIVDDETGGGAEFVLVRLVNADDQIVGSSQTDEIGAYRIARPAGDYRVFVSSISGFRPEVYDGIVCHDNTCPVGLGQVVTVASGEPTTGIDFSLARRGRISGTVVAADTGLPVVDALVRFSRQDGNVSHFVLTDERGAFSFVDKVDRATYFVFVGRTLNHLGALYDGLPCWGTSFPGCDVTAGTPIDLGLGDDLEITIEVIRGGTISGQFTDAATGEGLPGSVLLRFANTTTREGLRGPTGQNTYVARPLPPGSYVLVGLVLGGYLWEAYDDVLCQGGLTYCFESGKPIDVPLGHDVTGIDFALDRLGRVPGTVRDPSGVPLRAELRLLQADGDAASSTISSVVTGAFELFAFQGTYPLFVTAHGHEAQLFDGIPCDLPCDLSAGKPIVVGALNTEIEGIEVTLRRFGMLTGTVRDAVTDEPIVDATVLLWDNAGDLVDSLWTGLDGRFSSARVANGDYRIATARVGYRSEAYPGRPCPGTSETCDPVVGSLIAVAIETTTDLDIRLLPLKAIVFADGFETGDTTSWSAPRP